MDECTPRLFDIAQLRFLCESLYKQCCSVLEMQEYYSVNDPCDDEHQMVTDLIEHIANNTITYKIKHFNDATLTTAIDGFLDETFRLTGSYGITAQQRQHWQSKSEQLFALFTSCQQIESK